MPTVTRRLISVLAVLSFSFVAACSDDPSGGPSEESSADAGRPVDGATTAVDTGSAADTAKDPIRRTCAGTATSCTLLGSDCSLAKGCSREEACSGFPSSCYGRSQYTCLSQKGCYWSPSGSSGYCAGSARSCTLFDASSCSSQSGCSIERSCKGIPTSCSALSEYECALQPGCRLEGG